MKSVLALVAAFAAVFVCVVAEREPDLRVYKSFYRGDGGASSADEQGSYPEATNVGRRSFPAGTSTGGQGTFLGMSPGTSSGSSPKGTTGTAFGARPGGSGFFPGRGTKTVTTSGENEEGDEEANAVVPRRGAAAFIPGRVPKEIDSSEGDEDFDARSNNNNNNNRRQNNVPFPVNGVVRPQVTSRPPINPPLPSVGAVAFTAKRATPSTLASPSQVRFDDVVTNVGFGFDSYNGHFDSPEAGVYVFSWSGVSPPNSQFRLSLTLNGKQVGHAWADTNGYQSASNSVALALRRGDRVAMVVTEGRLYEPTSTNTGYTTFTGYKIQ